MVVTIAVTEARAEHDHRLGEQVAAGVLLAFQSLQFIEDILGLLAGTLLVSFSGTFGRAKHEIAKTGIGQIVQKIEVYRMETNEWPTNELGLRALSEGHATPADPYYLELDQLLDPWGIHSVDNGSICTIEAG